MSKLKKICQNWLKFEEAFDLMISDSRRNNKYCHSNRKINDAISNASGLAELITLMCGEDRYVKLYLFTLKKHGTLEFRLHQGTHNIEKIENWVRLIVYFVHNSRVSKSPGNFKSSTTPKEKYEKLFRWVIFSRYLYSYYNKRVKELENCGEFCEYDACGH
eukprot:gene6690-10855_t